MKKCLYCIVILQAVRGNGLTNWCYGNYTIYILPIDAMVTIYVSHIMCVVLWKFNVLNGVIWMKDINYIFYIWGMVVVPSCTHCSLFSSFMLNKFYNLF